MEPAALGKDMVHRVFQREEERPFQGDLREAARFLQTGKGIPVRFDIIGQADDHGQFRHTGETGIVILNGEELLRIGDAVERAGENRAGQRMEQGAGGEHLRTGSHPAFEGGALPVGVEPVRLAEEPVAAWRLRPLLEAAVEVRGDAVRVRARRFLPDFEIVRGGAVAIETESDRAPVFSPDGRLVQLRAARRRDSGDTAWSGERLAALAAGKEPFDPEIVPRTGKDRQRTAWFGVETQRLSKEVAREKKALGWISEDRYDPYSDGPSTAGALVSHVYPGSPAAEAGVEEGDILLYVRSPDGATRRNLEAGRSYSYYDDEDRITPWPTIGNGVDASFGSFGIGAPVVVEWLRDGALRRAELAVRAAPPHFRTATRARAKDLGLIVADATFEVREYFKLEEGETGVVVTKCKHGSPAAIAGLRPYELVTKVDGEPVADARSFLETVKGRDSFTLTVRRLTATRVVRISRKAAAPAEAGGPDPDAG